MKLLITTRADKNIKDITDLIHPIIKSFAKKWNADFSILSHISDCDVSDGRYHYRIMRLYDLLTEYDRIIQIDSDIIINKTCPNLFNLVPYNMIGTVLEDKGSRLNNRRALINRVQEMWGDISWKEGYINTGVFIVSKSHRGIFRRFLGNYWVQDGFDDVHLGYQIHRLGLKIFELDYRFNHMSIFSEEWNGNPLRFDSYIIHYAGNAKFSDKGKRGKVQLIEDDIKEIYEMEIC